MKNKPLILIVSAMLVIIVVLLVVITVNLVLKSQPVEIPPTVDLEAAVAQTIAAFTPTNTQPPTPTNTPTASNTPTPRPTKTNTPTITPLPNLPTRTPVPTRSGELPSGDPASELGEPTWVEPFHEAGDWGTDNNCIKTEVKNGVYTMNSKLEESGSCWEITWPRIQNYYLRARVINPKPCDGHDRFGVFFRGPNPSSGYLFGITCEGEYFLFIWDNEAKQTIKLIDYTESQFLRLIPGRNTDLGVYVAGKQIGLYINGRLIDEIYDDTYLEPGLIGLFIGSSAPKNLTVKFEELVYWDLDQP